MGLSWPWLEDGGGWLLQVLHQVSLRKSRRTSLNYRFRDVRSLVVVLPEEIRDIQPPDCLACLTATLAVAMEKSPSFAESDAIWKISCGWVKKSWVGEY